MPPKLNEKRALFVLTKIEQILACERRSEAERDTRFVEWDNTCVKCGVATLSWKPSLPAGYCGSRHKGTGLRQSFECHTSRRHRS